MLRSLFSGISGLRAHQTMMDVTGNNIANVNTAGYKSSQVVFQDTLSQMLKAAGAPQGAKGGTNPAQVGLGVQMGAITTNFSQGAAENTGSSTDLRIQGDGFFVVHDNGQELYTRAGAFSFDTGGKLVTPEGAVVQGWAATNGVINTNGTPGDIVLPIGTVLPPQPTTSVTIGGNLPSNSAPTDPAIVTPIDVYDAKGVKTSISLNWQKAASPADTWNVTYGGETQQVTFATDPTTNVSSPATPTISFTGLPATIDVSAMTSYAGTNTASMLSQNGSAMGSLQSFTLSPDGTLQGEFSNGLKQALGQIALANFNNPPGLEKAGDSLYRSTVNSGTPQLGVAGSGGRGLLASGSLEMSNVDLAQEFTNLIIAQRGFQANSKVITTSDQILQDLVNMKQ